MTEEARRLDRLCVDTIRTLAMDAVQQANSGHPGTPMAMAPVVYALWQRVLRFDPDDPIWPNRDRFVLSMGHASMLLYALLHLTGVKAVNPQYERLGELSVSLDDIRRFRQLDSKCPGHPEYRWTSGVETTTGPLGQGVATSVGMAMAGRFMAAHFNRPDFPMLGYDVYALGGDGCLMEGVSGEAASLAGHLRLSNLCWIYDNNRITIEGPTSLAFTEDVATRFIGYGWNVTRVGDANDLEMLDRAFQTFRTTTDRPTLIIVDSHIGWGAPHKQDTHAAHGEPLGEEEIRLTKRNYGWPEDAKFLVPDGVREHFAAGMGARGRAARREWMESFARYRERHPDLADGLDRMQHRRLPDGWDAELPAFPPDAKGVAGRDASGTVLNALARRVPWLVGGAADLAPSTKTRLTFEGAGDFSAGTPQGRNLHFGVREHAMGSVLNGLSLSKVRPYGAGFLIFSDYMRPAIRLSALMELPVIYVFTHDSIGVGEDGPTHQPIEQLASLRAIPGLVTLRPGDANEVLEAWRLVIGLRHEPVALILSRQALPTLDRVRYAAASGLAGGAYVLADAGGAGKTSQAPEVILMGSGSEVSLCVEAYERLRAEGVRARVVSMPSWELFDRQSPEYREAVLPAAVTARVAVEQGSTLGWDRWVGTAGTIIGMKTFGASAPLKELQRKFGFTPDHVVAAARAALERGEIVMTDQTWKVPAELEPTIRATIKEWADGAKVARLWRRDASLWTGADEASWLGWLSIVGEQRARLADFRRLAEDARTGGYRHVLLLGMGGSSLCPEVLATTFGAAAGHPALQVLDSTDPAQIRALEATIDPARTLFIVSSKSGSTLEPNIFKQYFFERARQAVGPEEVGRRFLAITDPGSKMQRVAEADRFRHVLHGVPSIGGRYSALSDFGMAPAAVMGLDVGRLLDGAQRMADRCAASVAVEENPGAMLGIVLGALGRMGRDKVTLIASPAVHDLGAWLEQLIAESTGKEGRGLIPVDREPVGGPRSYGLDRLFVYVRLAEAPDASQDAAVAALEGAGHPVVRITMADRHELAAEFFRWEMATAVAGSILGINPFDQPDVEASKIATRGLTDAYEKSGALPPESPAFEAEGVRLFTDERNAAALASAAGPDRTLAGILGAHLRRAKPGDYVALLAYVQMSGTHERALQAMRGEIRERLRVATCLGFGPRFLHSTGQAYKGGPNSGVFLQITCDDAADLPVPGQTYTFGVVKAAQARGDFAVLAERGRRALRAHLGKDVEAGLASLATAARAALGAVSAVSPRNS